MKNASERSEIETVLRGLSEVNVPPHLGQEIARELMRNGPTGSVTQRYRPWSFLWRPAMLGVACAALIALVLTTSLFRAPSGNIESLPERAYLQPQVPPTPPMPLQQLLSSTKVSTKGHIQKTRQVRQKRSASATPASTSIPAPVAPLSDQEKILVRIAQRGDPVQLASLNAELQEAMNTTRRNDFIKLSNGGNQ